MARPDGSQSDELAATVASTAGGAPSAAVTAGRPLTRSTILPRLSVVGREPVLVREERERYERLGLLGEGGIGQVHKARDNDIGRVVALKRLKPEVRDTSTIVRFVNEIRTVGQLEHPNIVPVHDVGADEEGEHYFVMKYVEGETLESIIARLQAGDPEAHRRYTFERRVEIFVGILEAIHYAHTQGVIHRDLKPANIMVGQFGQVVVMDWGLAKRLRGEEAAALDAVEASATPVGARDTDSRPTLQTAAGSVMGTPLYMSPEQARGEPVDERSDVYSLCVLFHELLCLRHYLADRRTLADVLEGVLNLEAPWASRARSPHQPRVPMDLTWFLRRGLAKRSEERYQSVAEMLDKLSMRREGLIPVQCHITFIKRASNEWIRFVDRHPYGVTAGLAVLVLAVIVLAVVAAL